jgi:hypothetical protein
MLVQLTIGDWSQDGHNIMETVLVETNLNRTEMEEAYRKGCAALMLNPLGNMCSEYEQDTFTKEEAAKLTEVGFPAGPDETVTSEDWVRLYIFFCKAGNPDIVIEEVLLDNINIGGYGLFWT